MNALPQFKNITASRIEGKPGKVWVRHIPRIIDYTDAMEISLEAYLIAANEAKKSADPEQYMVHWYLEVH